MSIRETNRKLTGMATYWEPEVVLGFDELGKPKVTVHASFHNRSYSCFSDPTILERLAADLLVAAAHIRGER
jgi:hypothetical protein